MRLIDLTGQRFGQLVVKERVVKPGGAWWRCQCDCGGFATVRGAALRFGNNISCGHINEDRKHGWVNTGTYKSWASAKSRCLNSSDDAYLDYGGRGITFWEGWFDFRSFLADMGKRPSGHTLERTNNDLGYCPSNCTWLPRHLQGRNKRNVKKYTFQGITLTMPEWAERVGVPLAKLDWRVRSGWPIEKALFLPIRKRPRLSEQERQRRTLARTRLHHAVKRGVIVKPVVCEHPGCVSPPVAAHHINGYDHECWLEVAWLCKPHHEEADAELNLIGAPLFSGGGGRLI